MDHPEKNDATTTAVTKAFLTYVVMPVWIIPGFMDWVYHRRTKIEDTSGTHESMIHSLMMASIGVPALLGLICEINASLIVTFAGAFALHEALVLWDVAYADGRRTVTPSEQHAHSFLEVLPFMSLSFVLCTHWDQALALAGAGPEKPEYKLQLKKEPVPVAFLAALFTGIGLFVALPYAEELVRCYRSDRTFAPHRKPL